MCAFLSLPIKFSQENILLITGMSDYARGCGCG